MKAPKNRQQLLFILSLITIVFVSSCKQDDESVTPSYDIPETYNFENAKYAGQTVRIQLLDSLGKLINSAKKKKVTKAQLLAVYENQNSLFGGSQKLSDKTAPGTEAQILSWFEMVEANSPMTNPGTRDWFFTPDGLDISQLVQKTLMGSVLYYQATSTYLDGIENDDNTTIKPEGYTDMEHYWDEAFGYYGAPIDFGNYTAEDILAKYKDTNGNGKQDVPSEKYYFHANYSITRDEASKTFTEGKTNFRTTLMENFAKGRAAIVNKDASGRDNAKKEILTAWEKQIAANAIHYFNSVAKMVTDNSTAKDDVFSRNHEWAEGRGFLNSLKYNNQSIISAAQWEEVNTLVGNAPTTTSEKLKQAATKLATVYGFSNYQRDNF